MIEDAVVIAIDRLVGKNINGEGCQSSASGAITDADDNGTAAADMRFSRLTAKLTAGGVEAGPGGLSADIEA